MKQYIRLFLRFSVGWWKRRQKEKLVDKGQEVLREEKKQVTEEEKKDYRTGCW